MALPNPITFGPARLIGPDGPREQLIPSNRPSEQCVFVPTELRGVLRNLSPEGRSTPVYAVPMRVVISDDPAGHNVIRDARFTLTVPPLSPIDGGDDRTSCPVFGKARPPRLTRASASPANAKRDTPITIAYSLDRDAKVDVIVADRAGRTIRPLATDQRTEAGAGRLRWDGLGLDGRPVRDGRYTIRMLAEADGAGSKATVSVAVDGAAPTVRAVTPKTLPRDRGLVVEVIDRSSGIRSAVLRVEDGEPIRLMRGQTSIVTRPAAGWQPRKRYRWSVRAIDRAGNVAEVARWFRVRA